MNKVVTVKISALMKADNKFYEEFTFPELEKFLNDGWLVKEVYQTSTNINVGFVFLTFILSK